MASGDTSRSFSGYTVENVFHDCYQAQQMMDGLEVLIKNCCHCLKTKAIASHFLDRLYIYYYYYYYYYHYHHHHYHQV
jgi:hypothetical protein